SCSQRDPRTLHSCPTRRSSDLGTLLGGIFNTFPYTSFSQNVGLVGVTGVRSRHVCVAGGAIMVVLGLIPKMGALVEALPTVVLGDRKSTRLNSSHVKISYAVFC